MIHAGLMVSFIHGTPLSMSPVTEAFGEVMPEARLRHVLDDSLLPAVEQAGGLTDWNSARLVRLVDHVLEEKDTDAVLIACSSYSPLVNELQDRDVPVLGPDESMFSEAVQSGASRIGVLVTVEPAVGPGLAKLQAEAHRHDRKIVARARCSPSAMAALRDGDRQGFEAALAQAGVELVEEGAELLLLGQYSMTGARRAVEHRTGCTVLTGPHAAARALREDLVGTRAPA